MGGPARALTTICTRVQLGLLPIDRARLPLDIIAGATLAALAIPEVMGYAKIAGTPVGV